jgi:hypothetical protein
VGIGTYSTTGPTLARTTVLSNSDGNTTPITLTSGSKQVFLTYPAEKSVNLDASGNVSPLGTVSSGTWQGATVGVAYGGTGVTASSGANSVMLRDANQNVSVNRLNQANTNTTAAGGTTALLASSTYSQTLKNTGSQTYTMPDATTLATGVAFVFNNNATGTLTLQDYATGAIGTITSGGAAELVLLDNSTVGGTWDVHGFLPEAVTWGTNALNLGTTVITGGTWNGGTVQSGYGGTGLTTFAGANNALYSTGASTLTAGTLPAAAGGTGLSSFTLNGIPYANTTTTLATGSALSFDGSNLLVGTTITPTGTGKISTASGYTAPDNAAGAGTTLNILGSTGTGQANATGGNGHIALIGGGGTSPWTLFSPTNGRRGGILLQAGLSAGDAGATYYHGSAINILGSNGTNNGTSTGRGSSIALTTGSSSTPAGTNNGATLTLIGGSLTVGGGVNLNAGGGNATGSNGGGLSILAGSSASGVGGAISITSGSGTSNGKIGFTVGNLGEVAQFDLTGKLVVNGVTVGRGPGAVATNTAVGANALAANTTNSSNTAVGANTLTVNTAGNNNTALGTNALKVYTEGYSVAIGANALFNSVTGNNTAVGADALTNTTAGGGNTAVGLSALLVNTVSNNNTAIGSGALLSYNRTVDTNGYNTVIGYQSGALITTGSKNTIIGRYNGNQDGLDIRTADNHIVLSDGDGNPRQVINASGNVGIGTSSPGAKLDVNGGALIQGLTIGRGAGAVAANTAVGASALAANISGNNNTANGSYALFANTTGNNNTANGAAALSSNLTGSGNTATGTQALSGSFFGDNNTANGYQALYLNFYGNGNTANGAYALYNNDGSVNTATGIFALFSNTSGTNNIATGYIALYSNTTGTYNIATGDQALYNNTTGGDNIATGFQALYSNTYGSGNIATGRQALYSSVGFGNIATGDSALYFNTSGDNNIAHGAYALWSNTTGYANLAIGSYFTLGANTTGSYNIAIGQQALRLNTYGDYNIAIGYDALYYHDSNSYNIAVGYKALYGDISGVDNVAIGPFTLYSNTSGTYNTATGSASLFSNTTGSYNTACGGACYSNTTGSFNTGIGKYALNSNSTGSGNTAINPADSTGGYYPVFDVTTEDNRFCMGSTSVTNAYIQVAWTVVSDARDKTDFAPVPHGLDFVAKLKPTTYRYKAKRTDTDGHGPLRYGFRAQDILELEGDNPVIVDAEVPEKLKLNDQSLMAVLVNAIQEQQVIIELLKARLDAANL